MGLRYEHKVEYISTMCSIVTKCIVLHGKSYFRAFEKLISMVQSLEKNTISMK